MVVPEWRPVNVVAVEIVIYLVIIENAKCLRAGDIVITFPLKAGFERFFLLVIIFAVQKFGKTQ